MAKKVPPKPSGEGREEYNVSPEDFVLIWQTSKSLDEATRRMSTYIGKNMPKEIVASRAAAYRNKGVHLKKMPRIKHGLDSGHLNKLVAEVDRDVKQREKNGLPKPPPSQSNGGKDSLVDEVLKKLKELPPPE
jgi:hypothetical protein